MPLDANGIHQFTETDAEATASDLLNLLAASTSDRVGDLQAAVDSKEDELGDTGWVTTGYTAASGVTVQSFEIRRIGSRAQVRVVATIATISVPVNGDVTNTSLLTVPAGYRPAHVASLSSSGVGRGVWGIVQNGTGDVQLTSVDAGGNWPAAAPLTNLQVSLGGTYFID